jgi:hypothetical protein
VVLLVDVLVQEYGITRGNALELIKSVAHRRLLEHG